jgi:hypothetical protein
MTMNAAQTTSPRTHEHEKVAVSDAQLANNTKRRRILRETHDAHPRRRRRRRNRRIFACAGDSRSTPIHCPAQEHLNGLSSFFSPGLLNQLRKRCVYR